MLQGEGGAERLDRFEGAVFGQRGIASRNQALKLAILAHRVQRQDDARHERGDADNHEHQAGHGSGHGSSSGTSGAGWCLTFKSVLD